jgi:predicted nucleic acid-binding protein
MKRLRRIYLDACCVNRPFDDQSQERIHLETEAIETILLHMEQGEWIWVGSGALMYEAENLTDIERQSRIIDLLAGVREWVQIGDRERQRAAALMAMGFKPLDALHVACGESAGSEVLLTTDDRLLKLGLRRAGDLQLRVANPLRWLEEQIL